MTSHNSSTRSAHASPPRTHSQHSSSGSTRKHSSKRKASTTGGSSRRGRAMPQRIHRSRSSRAMKWLEPRLLLITTGVTLFGVLLQIVAISTDSWLIMDARDEGGHYRNTTETYVTETYTGLWRWCQVELERKVDEAGNIVEITHESCHPHDLFPSSDEFQQRTEYERHHLDYTRTAIAFTIIALVIMLIGHAFAFYALRRPRYIIKRLAALLHFMTAACLLVLNEVFVKTVKHMREKMPERIPKDAYTHYGYSFVLSWLVFVIFVLSGLIFLFTSHKKKAEYADGTEALEDEPMEIRR